MLEEDVVLIIFWLLRIHSCKVGIIEVGMAVAVRKGKGTSLVVEGGQRFHRGDDLLGDGELGPLGAGKDFSSLQAQELMLP